MNVTETQSSSRTASSQKPMTSCGEWVDDRGTRCGLPAQVLDRYVLASTNGPIEHIRTRCTAGHSLHCSVESLA